MNTRKFSSSVTDKSVTYVAHIYLNKYIVHLRSLTQKATLRWQDRFQCYKGTSGNREKGESGCSRFA